MKQIHKVSSHISRASMVVVEICEIPTFCLPSLFLCFSSGNLSQEAYLLHSYSDVLKTDPSVLLHRRASACG